MDCNPTVYKEKIDNKVIQVEREIYWEAKSKTLYCFSINLSFYVDYLVITFFFIYIYR